MERYLNHFYLSRERRAYKEIMSSCTSQRISCGVYDKSPLISGEKVWLDILKVSYLWKMKKMGEYAIDRLSKMQLNGVEKLKLAQTYNIQDRKWRYSAIRELVNSTNLSLREADMEEIGVDIALKISKLHGMGRQRWFFYVSDENVKKEFPELF